MIQQCLFGSKQLEVRVIFLDQTHNENKNTNIKIIKKNFT